MVGAELPASGLEFFFSEKNGFLVVSFIGHLDPDSKEILQNIQDEAQNYSSKKVVFNFHDIFSVHESVYPQFLALQQSIRDRGCFLRICFVHPQIKEELIAKKQVVPSELINSLFHALKSFPAGIENTAQVIPIQSKTKSKAA